MNEATVFRRLSDPAVARRAWSGLTPDLLEKARDRVKILAWIMLALMGIGALFDLLYFQLVIGLLNAQLVVGSIIGVGLAAVLVVLSGSRLVTDLTVLRLALVYEVVICFFLAVFAPWIMYVEIGDVPYVTWVTPLIIFFPLIVPSPPHMTLIAAITAATTRPLGLAVLEGVAGFEIPAIRYVASSVSPALAVALAYLGSRIVYGMNVDLAEARKLGCYALESRLGEGGMGEVWRANHCLLARPAAVKFIRPEVVARDPESQGTMLARFEQEAQVTASMSSPHTIQVYDFGIEQGGTFYYVMELLRGLDMDALVKRFGPLPPARSIYLLEQICDSLGEAHENGLIHRDVKPANVYVCRYGRQVDWVKVLDFGLVKLHHHDGSEDVKLTAEFSAGGTPAFIAPEQVAGEEVDGRADIYSLGCVAFWMLTATHVFEGSSGLQTMVKHVRERPPAPSSRTEQSIPPALDQIVLKCLEKDPSRRPQTVDALADMLAACDGAAEWTQHSAARWWTDHLPEM